MQLGEVSPGGVGVGLNGMLVLALLAVFIAGLMVGRTPEYLGKKIQASEVKLVVLYILAMPFAVLVGTGIAIVTPTRARTSRSGTRARTGSPRCSTRSPPPGTTTARRSPGSPRTPSS